MTTPADVGISDIDIQNYFDDDLNSQILGFFAHGQAFKWHYRTRPNNGEGFYTGLFGISIWQLLVWESYVLPTSSRARYDLNGPLFLGIIATTATALNLIIADCTIIWRCWVVWAHDWRIIILPIFFVVGEIVCGGIGVVSEFMPWANMIDETQVHWAVATMAATLGTNILCTTLIVATGHRGVMDAIRTYRGVVEIMVESAALYSIVFVVLMILYPLDSYAYFYPLALCYPVTGIAPTLIVLRVASGQGRPEESSLETQSSLHFQASRGSTIETAMDEGEEDTMQGNTGGIAPVLSGSFEQV
ncbi:hypothetical protein F5146DRAFT_1189250 [Armillaria mellea]|nr:hypothetical protein F5146DRAFT_1189250 [Armillaria mellea]